MQLILNLCTSIYSKGDRKHLEWTLSFSKRFIINWRKQHVASGRRLVELTAGQRDKPLPGSGTVPGGAPPCPTHLGQPGSTGLSGHPLA